MGYLLARSLANGPDRAPLRCMPISFLPLLISLAIFFAGCHHISPVDTKPLDTAGMTYDAIQQLKALQITVSEVGEVARARQSGFSDANCVEIFKISRDKNQAFGGGDAVAQLVQAQVSEDTILELARLNQLGLSAGEFQAMRLAGLSDAIVLEVARHQAANNPVLSGASLAGLKNMGVRESTLLELARRGVPDSKANAIISSRRQGASDAEILGHFTGS